MLAVGFDLGVGILFLAAPRDADRDIMMASIEPVWDGNETWLVMGGTLFAAFPAGYYVLPAFYLPIMFMLFALIFRGIAFGFRLQAVSYRWVWDIAFAGGSVWPFSVRDSCLAVSSAACRWRWHVFRGLSIASRSGTFAGSACRRLRSSGRRLAHLEDQEIEPDICTRIGASLLWPPR